MLVIDTLRGRVLTQLVDHMTNVMQQSRCDQCIGQTLLSRMLGGLNRVRPLIDQAQSIGIQRARLVDIKQFRPQVFG